VSLYLSPLQAQRSGGSAQGVPASVLTMSSNNPPASVLTTPPPSSQQRPVFIAGAGHHHGHNGHDGHHGNHPSQPIYPVYGYGYPYYYGDYDTEPAGYQPEQGQAADVVPEAPAQTIFENRPGYKAPPPVVESPSYKQQPSEQPAPGEAVAVEPQPATVLIFKDGHQIEIGNYVIKGDVIYNLSSAYRSFKIQIADLDVDATVKANEDRGTEIHLPTHSAKTGAS